MVSIQDNLNLWISPDVTGTLDGKNWWDAELMKAVQNESETLPHLEEAIVAFMTGALVGFDKFTVEFEPGSLIDSLTLEELLEMFFSTTNCVNEGGLGSVGVAKWRKGNQTLEKFNSHHKVERNGTDGYIAEHLNTEEDQQYLWKHQQEVEKLGLAKIQKQIHMDAANAKRTINVEKGVKRVEKEVQKTVKIDEIGRDLCLDFEEIGKLSNPKLLAQLLFHREQEKDMPKAEHKVKPANHLKNIAEQVEALQEAAVRYQSRSQEQEAGCSGRGDELYESEKEDE
ncbi:hypothetical protein C8J56DRAFT_772045 [Mycena floridula]|nr:hypothetical protein C8J56DRAFT_772045 [Mycena floridula]